MQSTPGQIYSVDITIGKCTCTACKTGTHCNEAAAAENSMLAMLQALALSTESRKQLAGVALRPENFLMSVFPEASKWKLAPV